MALIPHIHDSIEGAYIEGEKLRLPDAVKGWIAPSVKIDSVTNGDTSA